MPIDKLAEVPLSFPTYAGVLGRAAAMASRTLKLKVQTPDANFSDSEAEAA
jgi:hypothetical protein